MKKKLLITMGCSITEGEGCYDYSIMSEIVPLDQITPGEIKPHLPRFHEFGWPNRVGKKLGFDKVLNISLRGSSNTVQLYRFIGIIHPQIDQLKQEYDLYIIWMMTDPTRFSFSGAPRFVNFIPSQNKSSSLSEAYIKDSITKRFIPEIDQAYILRSAEIIFKSLDIKFIFTSWNKSFLKLQTIFHSDFYLTPYPHYFDIVCSPEEKSKICSHPNELGYERIAIQMVELIDKFHPLFRVGKEKSNIDWEFLEGDEKSPSSYPYILNKVDYRRL